jgi:hypothetical protein
MLVYCRVSASAIAEQSESKAHPEKDSLALGKSRTPFSKDWLENQSIVGLSCVKHFGLIEASFIVVLLNS